jgi:hypothetical protein
MRPSVCPIIHIGAGRIEEVAEQRGALAPCRSAAPWSTALAVQGGGGPLGFIPTSGDGIGHARAPVKGVRAVYVGAHQAWHQTAVAFDACV